LAGLGIRWWIIFLFMDIAVLGFNLIPGKFPLDTVLQSLTVPLRTEDNRIMALTRDGDYWRGILLSIRDVKSFAKIQENGGSFTITTQELEKDTRPVDFNFFIINAKTFTGLYQYYHHSASINAFCYIVKKHYDQHRKDAMDAEIRELGENPSNKLRLSVIEKYKGKLRYQTLMRPEGFEACLAALKRIKLLEFQCAEFKPEIEEYRPLSGLAKRITHKIIFQNDSVVGQIVAPIKRMIDRKSLLKARAIGIDNNDIEQIYKLENDLATLATYDYDQMARGVQLDSNNLPKTINDCQITLALLKLAEGKTMKATLEATVLHEAEEIEDDEDEVAEV
jgi:hypothetical protein